MLEEFIKPVNFNTDKSNGLKEIYNYKSIELEHMHKMRIYLFVELVRDLIKTGVITKFDSAIDIGCNRGLYSKLISELGYKNVLGIDIEESLINVAKQNFEGIEVGKSIKFEVVNAENIDLSTKYDFILCTEVIEHTQNQAKTIENLKSILNKGGIAIITLPNVISFPYILTWISYKLHGRKFDQEMIDHLSYPYYKTINLFKNKPYKLIKTTGTNLFYWHFLHKFPGFNSLNVLNFKLGKLWPFKFFNQYFYIVLKND
ncbi:MAG: methyltransferase domain-containing protein [Bacteroidetes bacterium]|nr:methyltransferase domain-containing protein [Bacteroidota bacterium]